MGPRPEPRRNERRLNEPSPSLSQRRRALKRARGRVKVAHKALQEAQEAMESLGKNEVDRGVEWASWKALDAVRDLSYGLKLLKDRDGT